MKRFFAMVLAMCMMGTTTYAAELPAKYVTAKPAVQEVTLDGHSEMMQCYNINGYNYFRLRDVAQVVTEHIADPYHHFNVGYNKERNFVSIDMQEEYVPVEGSKTYVIGTEEKQGVLSDSQIFVTSWYDAQGMYGYVIDGYTFYKLRELAKVLEMDVNWNEEAKTIEVASSTATRGEGAPRGID